MLYVNEGYFRKITIISSGSPNLSKREYNFLFLLFANQTKENIFFSTSLPFPFFYSLRGINLKK